MFIWAEYLGRVSGQSFYPEENYSSCVPRRNPATPAAPSPPPIPPPRPLQSYRALKNQPRNHHRPGEHQHPQHAPVIGTLHILRNRIAREDTVPHLPQQAEKDDEQEHKIVRSRYFYPLLYYHAKCLGHFQREGAQHDIIVIGEFYRHLPHKHSPW